MDTTIPIWSELELCIGWLFWQNMCFKINSLPTTTNIYQFTHLVQTSISMFWSSITDCWCFNDNSSSLFLSSKVFPSSAASWRSEINILNNSVCLNSIANQKHASQQLVPIYKNIFSIDPCSLKCNIWCQLFLFFLAHPISSCFKWIEKYFETSIFKCIPCPYRVEKIWNSSHLF